MKELRTNISRGNKTQVIARPATPDQTEIIRLVERAVSGDFEAFGELYGIYLDRIYRFVFYQLKDKMAAEDATEEVFIKAYKIFCCLTNVGVSYSPSSANSLIIVPTLTTFASCLSFSS